MFLVGQLPGMGEVSTEDGVTIRLNGLGLLVFAAVVLAYHFAFEVTSGRSLGKALLGLRVVTENGERATPKAIAVRTALRLVDALPALYLVGFIAMLASTPRGRRLGDMAAKTAVIRG